MNKTQPTLMGLTQTHWKQYEDILIIANKEQKFEMFKKLVVSMNKDNPNLMIRFCEEMKLAKVGK